MFNGGHRGHTPQMHIMASDNFNQNYAFKILSLCWLYTISTYRFWDLLPINIIVMPGNPRRVQHLFPWTAIHFAAFSRSIPNVQILMTFCHHLEPAHLNKMSPVYEANIRKSNMNTCTFNSLSKSNELVQLSLLQSKQRVSKRWQKCHQTAFLYSFRCCALLTCINSDNFVTYKTRQGRQITHRSIQIRGNSPKIMIGNVNHTRTQQCRHICSIPSESTLARRVHCQSTR